MLRLALLSLLLGAGMCQTDVSSAPGGAASSASADAPSPGADRDPESPPRDAQLDEGAEGEDGRRPSTSGLAFPLGTWQLTKTGGASMTSVATITWTFHSDGTGVYAQDVKGRMMDAADASRPFQWTRVSDGVVRVEASTFTRTGTRSARWSDSGSSGTLQRWE